MTELARLVSTNNGGIEAPQVYYDSEIEGFTSSNSSESSGGKFTKSIVLGGLDGLISSFIIVSSASGAKMSWKIVLIFGVSYMVASSLSSGMNEFISSKAHKEFIHAEKRRATWQYKNFKTYEINQMIDRLENSGMTKADAQFITHKLATYEDIFVNRLLIEELGMQLPDDDDAMLLADSLVMLLSFGLVGTVPLWVYFCRIFIDIQEDMLYSISCGVSVLVIAILGIMKSYYSSSYWLYSMVESVFVAFACGGTAYFVGVGLQNFISNLE